MSKKVRTLSTVRSIDDKRADLNRAAKIVKRERREFDGSAGSMCGSCVVRGEINNAIEKKIQALVRK